MKKKKIVIIFIPIVILLTIIISIYIYNKNVKEVMQRDELVVPMKEDNKNIIENETSGVENIQETNDLTTKHQTEVQNEEKEEVHNKKENEKVNTETKQETNKNEINEIKKPNDKNEINEKEKEESNEKIEIIPEKQPWEELGITEDEYYNKPMWSWARIDYSIDKYKSYEKARAACMEEGEKLFEEGYGYSCTSINSYSGKYLGEMLKKF